MAYSKEVLAEIERTLPPADVTRDRVRAYRTRSDMTMPLFARLVDMSVSAINQFLDGTYSQRAGTDIVIRKKIEDAIARHPVGELSAAPVGKLYETENSADLRHWFHHCHANRALGYCYGPPGSQKTFVLKHLVQEFNRAELRRGDVQHRAFYVRASVNQQPRDLVVKMCQSAGAQTGASLQRCMTGLRLELRGAVALFVFDEAQMLSIPCLEAVRELHDEEPRIGALLAGSHTLKQLFDRCASQLEQWNSRLDAGFELRGVSEERARLIIHGELPHLSARVVEKLIAGSRVPDAYSRTNTTYLNVRRLFKNMDAYKLAAAQAKPKGRAA